MLRIPSLLLLAGTLIVTLAITACGSDRRLTEHTRAEPAPRLDLPEELERPGADSDYTLPETRRAEQLDADALRALQLPPEPRGEPAEDPDVRSDGPRLTSDEPPRLRIPDDRDTVWSRLTAALAAGGFTVLERDRVEQIIRVRDVEGGTEDGEGERRLVLEGSEPVVLRVTDADGNPLPEEETRRILGILRDRL
ncbi:MAG: hypothetical protein ACQERG_06055 [Pseudomonadota bacterium]